jgi:phenylacetate-CoA ligase
MSSLATDFPAITPRQAERLAAMFSAILPVNRFYAKKLAGFKSPGGQAPRLAELPFTTKAEIVADQEEHPPYGSNLTESVERYTRLHQTSGTSTGRPLRWLDTPRSWEWMLECWRHKFAFMRLAADERFFFPFSFGPFLGFWTGFEAAARAGYLCLPGGGMSTAARLRFLLEHQATVVCATPTYALHLAEAARQEGLDLAGSSVRVLIVAGEPGGGIPATRKAIETAWGARVFDHYGMTEIGPVGIECRENPGGLHLVSEACVAEVIDPQSGESLPPDLPGELVLTNLGRWGSPLIRYRTGDLVRIDPNPCPCGRPDIRLIGGILGRTDDMVYLRGNNLYPAAIEGVIRRFPEVVEFRVTIDRSEALAGLRIEIEPRADAPASVTERVARAIRDELMVRPEVTSVSPGTLPRFEMKAKRTIHHGTHGKHGNKKEE